MAVVLPEAVRFFPCSDAKVDHSGRITLVDPIYLLQLLPGTQFPTPIGEIFFYVHLIGGVGICHCRVQILDEKEATIASCEPVAVEFDGSNRFNGVEFLIQFPKWNLPAPGLCRCALMVNYRPEPISISVIRFADRSLP